MPHPPRVNRVLRERAAVVVVLFHPFVPWVDQTGRADEVEQIVLRITPRGGELGRKALDREGVVDIGHRAQPPNAEFGWCVAGFQAQVRHCEGIVGSAETQLAPGRRFESGPKGRRDGRKDRAVQKGGTAAVGVERALQVLRAHRVVVAVTQIVLAGPGDLDGLAHFACQQRRFDHKIRFDLRPNAPPSHVT